MSCVDSITSVEYREIPGVIGYRFGSDGTVWSRWIPHAGPYPKMGAEWRLMKQGKGRKGYATVAIRGISESSRTQQVHVLVCRAFHGLPPLMNLEARHLDDDHSDNRAENLAWGSRKQNAEDAIRNGRSARGERVNLAKLTEADVREIRRLRAAGVRRMDIAAMFGINGQTVYTIVLRNTWKHVD